MVRKCSEVATNSLGPRAVGASFGVPCALAQCPSNALNALVNRHLTAPKNPIRIALHNFFTRELATVMKRTYFQKLSENLHAEWRVGKTQVKLAQIDRSTIFDGLQQNKAKAFTKFEISTKVPTKARIIQGNMNERTAYEHPWEYQALAQTLKEIPQFEIDGVTFDLHYAGGLNHDELSDLLTEWCRGTNWYLDERDGKNWDSTMQKATLLAEYDLYAFLGMKSAKRFFERCSGVKGYMRFKDAFIKYYTAWKRLSGDWNTSVGNTIISMMILVTAILMLPKSLRPKVVHGLFMGDDYLGAYHFDHKPDPTALCAALNEYESLCGITPERGIFEDPYSVTFISLGVWPRLDGGLQFVPQPAKQMRKLFWSVKRLDDVLLADYEAQIAEAFWPVYHGWEMMMAFLKLHYHPRRRKHQFELGYMHWMLTPRPRGVNWQMGFVWKYSIPYTACNFPIERNLGECIIYHHPVVERMLEIESQDPCDRRWCLAH